MGAVNQQRQQRDHLGRLGVYLSFRGKLGTKILFSLKKNV